MSCDFMNMQNNRPAAKERIERELWQWKKNAFRLNSENWVCSVTIKRRFQNRLAVNFAVLDLSIRLHHMIIAILKRYSFTHIMPTWWRKQGKMVNGVSGVLTLLCHQSTYVFSLFNTFWIIIQKYMSQNCSIIWGWVGPTRHLVKSGLFGSEKVIEPLLFLASTLTVTGGRWGGWSFRGPSPLGGGEGEWLQCTLTGGSRRLACPRQHRAPWGTTLVMSINPNKAIHTIPTTATLLTKTKLSIPRIPHQSSNIQIIFCILKIWIIDR